MAFEYSIWVKQIKVEYNKDGLENVVTSIMASMSGYDTDSIGKFRGRRGHVFIEDEEYEIAAPNPASFKAFNTLTEADCITFIKGTQRYAEQFEELEDRVKELQPSTTQGLCALPWD
tara:strand:- start:63 stop:413 length:351 start_codon:yes stop_codon:yes gene_type:complete